MASRPEEKCHYCGGSMARHLLRPYGPGGALVCFPCAMATPERAKQTERGFENSLAKNERDDTVLLTAVGLAPPAKGGQS